MQHVLVHATPSPQEAEELAARLRAAGVEVEVRNTGANNFVGMVDPTRPAWELWISEAAQPAAQAVVTKALADFQAQGKELEKDLEAEALASPPAEGVASVPPASKAVASRNARIAAALMLASVAFTVGRHLFLRRVGEPLSLSLMTYLHVVLQPVVALALWKGAGGARFVGVAWVVLTGLYYTSVSLGSPPLVPLLHVLTTLGLLVLLLGPDSPAPRWAGIGLWAVALAGTAFPLELAPARLTDDKLAGLWKHPHSSEQVAFCADGRYFVGYPVFSSDGKWERIGMHEVRLDTGDKHERHSYGLGGDRLYLFKQSWERQAGESPCDTPPKK